MTKTLIKKQMLEVFAWLYQDKKTGKHRNKGKLLAFCGLYILILGFLMCIFFVMASSTCKPLVDVGFGWLYIALMGLIGTTFGTFGSVFNTYATLYTAKDNDLLLSMPVPVQTVLKTRLFGVYVLGLLCELVVMLPTVFVFFQCVKLNIAVILFSLLIPLVLSAFILTLSCVLGWIVACISHRLKAKKFLTVLILLGFICGYYYLVGSMGNILQAILQDPAGMGEKVKGILYPLYHMGQAAEGNGISFLIFTGIVMAFFLLIYTVLRNSFLKLATANHGSPKVKYVEKTPALQSPRQALLSKEFRRFFGSTTYMMNCGLGVIIIILAAIVLFIKQDAMRNALQMTPPLSDGWLSLFAAAALCMCSSISDITAPSVSLEGKTVWLAQVLPVSGWQVLKAKAQLHLILMLPPFWLLTASVAWVLRLTPVYALFTAVITSLFTVLIALLGLVFNLKMPMLDWTSEVVPIKQGMPVMLSLFGGWGLVILLGGAFYLLRNLVSPYTDLFLVTGLLLVLDLILWGWLKGKGGRLFERL